MNELIGVSKRQMVLPVSKGLLSSLSLRNLKRFRGSKIILVDINLQQTQIISMADSKNTGVKKTTLEMVSEQINSSDSFESFSSQEAKKMEETLVNIKSATGDLTREIEKAVSEGVRKIQKTANDYAGALGENTAEAREQAKKVVAEGEKFVKQKPVQSVLGALVIGLFLGTMMRRR